MKDDLISRQAAIDEAKRLHDVAWANWKETRISANTMIDALEQLPSAQPEPLTDKEQRIFLSAMGREEKVCKEVDEECRAYCEPYEDSLVSVCREITRKVKGVLWT